MYFNMKKIMRRWIPLLFLTLVGCGERTEVSSNGLSTEWHQNEKGTVDTLVIKRRGIAIAEFSAVSNAFFVSTTGGDGYTDLRVNYYGTSEEDAAVPESITHSILKEDGSIEIISYTSDGTIEQRDTISADEVSAGAKQD